MSRMPNTRPPAYVRYWFHASDQERENCHVLATTRALLQLSHTSENCRKDHPVIPKRLLLKKALLRVLFLSRRGEQLNRIETRFSCFGKNRFMWYACFSRESIYIVTFENASKKVWITVKMKIYFLHGCKIIQNIVLVLYWNVFAILIY